MQVLSGNLCSQKVVLITDYACYERVICDAHRLALLVESGIWAEQNSTCPLLGPFNRSVEMSFSFGSYCSDLTVIYSILARWECSDENVDPLC